MKHLVIYTHINPKSFSNAILETIVETSTNQGAEVIVRNLNEMNFNPVLSAKDMESFEKGIIPSDIKIEQDNIISADIISFIYPLWWGHMPAIMKGYIDRVFAHNFAFRYENETTVGLLPGKKILLFTPMGNSTEMYEAMGMIDALNLTTDTCIFRFCGMTDISHLHFGAVPMVSNNERVQMLNNVKQLVIEKLK